MANFCTYCGRPIPEGGICDCPASRAAAQQQAYQQVPPQQPPQQPYMGTPTPTYPQQPARPNPTVEKLKGVFGRLIPFLKSYFKDPLAATSAALRQHDLGVAVVVMIVYALLCGFCLLVTFKHLISQMGASEIIGVPFFSTMGLMIVAAAIVLALRVLVTFAMVRFGKINATIMDALIATGINALFPACVLLLMLIGVLISWYIFVILAALGLVLQIILFTNVLTRAFGVKPQGAYAIVCAVLLCAAMLISAWLNSKLIVQSAKGWYNKDDHSIKVGDYIDDIGDIFNEIY